MGGSEAKRIWVRIFRDLVLLALFSPTDTSLLKQLVQLLLLHIIPCLLPPPLVDLCCSNSRHHQLTRNNSKRSEKNKYPLTKHMNDNDTNAEIRDLLGPNFDVKEYKFTTDMLNAFNNSLDSRNVRLGGPHGNALKTPLNSTLTV